MFDIDMKYSDSIWSIFFKKNQKYTYVSTIPKEVSRVKALLQIDLHK